MTVQSMRPAIPLLLSTWKRFWLALSVIEDDISLGYAWRQDLRITRVENELATLQKRAAPVRTTDG